MNTRANTTVPTIAQPALRLNHHTSAKLPRKISQVCQLTSEPMPTWIVIAATNPMNPLWNPRTTACTTRFRLNRS